MTKSQVRPITFFTVFLGLAFFCNPTFAAIDVLPDFIGCLLICLGLSRVSRIHAGLREVKKSFYKVAIVDICKNIALVMVLGMGSAADKPTVLLILTFAATVLGLIFLIPAVRLLFDQLLSLSIAYDCKELYQSELGGLGRTERTRKCLVVFLFVRDILCLLPEFAALATSTNNFNRNFWNRIYDYITLLRSTAFLLVGVAGVVCFFFLFVYWLHFRYEREMQRDLAERYCAYRAAHPGFAVEQRHAAAFCFLAAGAALLVDFYLDYRNIFPDALAGVLLLIGLLIPAASRRLRIGGAVLAGLYTAISAVSSHFAYAFNSRYIADAIYRSEEAGRAYLLMWVTALAELLIFIALLAVLLMLLRDVIFEHAGYRAHHAESDLEEDEEPITRKKPMWMRRKDDTPMPDHIAPDELHQARFANRSLRLMRGEFDRKLIRLFIFGFISALLSFLFDYIKTMPGKGIYHLLEFTWVFDFCAAVIFAVMFIVLLVEIFREIRNKFRFDE
ncbi:MAG: hypothetical protein E7590_06570 [Ruminococcaceae bacterium]|nr:hypothetical protein [Oscillospiraceae bacterium]